MKRISIMGNGPDRTIGNFDRARVQEIIDIVTPIFAGQRKPVKPNLSPDDLVTNEFIDPSIGLG